MAIQKNFKIANGLEVNDNLIFADKEQNTVGIGTTVTQEKLQVIGGIGATDLVLSGVGTIPVLKSTDALISNGYINVGVITSLTGTAATITGVSGNVKIGTGTTALVVEGDTRVTGILTVGTSSLTLNGETNQINGVTISSGIVTATTFSGDLSLSDGSASAPSIKFSSSTTTGIYSPGTNQFAITTNGVGRITIDASGNIVAGGTLTAGSFIPTSSTVPTNGLYSPGTNQLALSVNGSEGVRLTTTGLGIGTSAPGVSLAIAVPGPGSSDGAYGGGQATATNSYRSFEWGLRVTGEASEALNGRAGIKFRLDPGTGGSDSSIRFITNKYGASRAERMIITSTGNVGIGTTSPARLLHLAKSSGNTDIQLSGATSTAGLDIVLEDSSGIGFLTARESTGQWVFRTGGANERARIDSSGRLLVGTSTARSNFYNSNGTTQFQIEGTDYLTAAASIVSNSSIATFGPHFALGRSRGTAVGSNTLVAGNDLLGAIFFQGADGAEFVPGALIKAEVDGTPGPNDMPGRLVFSTTADGASSPTERMRIDSAGTTTLTSSTSTAPFIAKINTSEVARIDSSGRLLVGTSSARANFFNSTGTGLLQVEGTAGGTNRATMSLTNNSSTNDGAWFVLNKSNGTSNGSNTLVSNGNTLGSIGFQGNDGSEFVFGAIIAAEVDGTPGANDMPGRLVFSTTADGASTPTERMRITSGGKILLGTTTAVADETIRVGGSIRAANTPALVNGVFNATDSVYELALQSPEDLICGKFQGLINATAVGDSTISVRLLTSSNWSNHTNCILKLYQSLRHANAGVFDIKEQHYHFQYKYIVTSGLVFPTTPAYSDSATGQNNESATITLSSPTFRGLTQGAPYYVQFDLALGSGRTSPQHSVFYELTLFRA